MAIVIGIMTATVIIDPVAMTGTDMTMIGMIDVIEIIAMIVIVNGTVMLTGEIVIDAVLADAQRNVALVVAIPEAHLGKVEVPRLSVTTTRRQMEPPMVVEKTATGEESRIASLDLFRAFSTYAFQNP